MQREVDQLLSLYENAKINRHTLLEAISAVAAAVDAAEEPTGTPARGPIVQARTINHIMITTADVGRSKAFYQRLAGLEVLREGERFCELKLGNGTLSLFELVGEQRRGLGHLCFGIDGYEPEVLIEQLMQTLPEAHPVLENGEIYLRDPDGACIQFADAG